MVTAVMGLWRAKDAKAEADTPLVVGEKEIAALPMPVALSKMQRKSHLSYAL